MQSPMRGIVSPHISTMWRQRAHGVQICIWAIGLNKRRRDHEDESLHNQRSSTIRRCEIVRLTYRETAWPGTLITAVRILINVKQNQRRKSRKTPTCNEGEREIMGGKKERKKERKLFLSSSSSSSSSNVDTCTYIKRWGYILFTFSELFFFSVQSEKKDAAQTKHSLWKKKRRRRKKDVLITQTEIGEAFVNQQGIARKWRA